MIIPKGPIWQQLRADCLDAIPEGSRFPYNAPRPLSVWHRNGYYTLSAVTGKGFELLSTSDELGAALLADAEHLLDHAAEHHACLHSVSGRRTWDSPVWVAVTAYYWCFFCALALTRLVGKTIWFLDRGATGHLNSIGPTVGTVRHGAGAYKLICGAQINSSQREVHVLRSKHRLHEAVWKQIFSYFSISQLNFGDESGSQLEYRLFEAIRAASGQLGPDWPSAVRSVVNYRPGCAYNEVRKVNVMDLVRFVRRVAPMSSEELIDLFETEGYALHDVAAVGVNPAPFCRLLVTLAFVLNALCHELHEDLMARRSFDWRWANARAAFLKTTTVSAAGVLWPYDSVLKAS